MSTPSHYSFTRYLSAKKSVDDRALNRHVWQSLAHNLPRVTPNAPLSILEIGAGIGTMFERMLAWNLFSFADYTAIDSQPENIAHIRERLPKWAAAHGYNWREKAPDFWTVERSNPTQKVNARFETCDLFDFTDRETGRREWDLLVAHAFLDLMDVPDTLSRLVKLLKEGGLLYLTINFDAATILEPAVDPELEALIEAIYHQTMDERITDGKPSGDSRAGRHLFTHLKHAGIQILDAGSSDWVVFPGAQGYTQDEAYFLHFILHTIDQAIGRYPQLDSARFEKWLAERHAQVARGELVYIAHQLDFLGKIPVEEKA